MAAASPVVREEIAKNRSHPDADGDNSIRMVMDGVTDRLGASDRLLASAVTAFQAATECGGETLAGVLDVLSRRVGGGGYQSTRIVEQCA
jgi:hypothetical protein